MRVNLTNYKTLVFDCDGVILNSNKIKTAAFYQAALPYGKAAAQALVDYHVSHGGISRFKKFAYFLKYIVPVDAPDIEGSDLEQLLKNYADAALQGLLTCEIAEGLDSLRKQTQNARWLIVSGGDQDELREVFAQRGLIHLFDGGIFGSPDTKDTILKREPASGNIMGPALFLGDSKYDYQAASGAGLDFIFLSGWSEVINWQGWCQENDIFSIRSVDDLL